MPSSEPWTVGRLLQWTTDYLKDHGSDSPRLDAEVLLAESLGCGRIELYTSFAEEPGEEPRAAMRQLVQRRAEGTPVAYLVGRREFYSLAFRVTPDVLIPRPETELLVVTLLDLARERLAEKLPVELPEKLSDEPIHVCDVGTGSGIIAVCVAKYLPGSRVTAVDISPAALDVARSNAEAHGVADRVELIQSNLLAAVPAQRRFDFICSNPPYVSESEMETLAPDVKDHEPEVALLGGRRGTEVIEALIPQAAERLKPGGHLLVEVSPMVHAAVRALLAAEDRLELGRSVNDLARLPRVVHAVKRE
jgi:release factor glutamine methyltransferase